MDLCPVKFTSEKDLNVSTIENINQKERIDIKKELTHTKISVMNKEFLNLKSDFINICNLDSNIDRSNDNNDLIFDKNVACN